LINKTFQKRLQEEVGRVLGERTEITYEDLIRDLKYCSSVFKETLRLWTPVVNLDRNITEPMVIGGFHVPAHTNVTVSYFKYIQNK
jgi:cytochrome P450